MLINNKKATRLYVLIHRRATSNFIAYQSSGQIEKIYVMPDEKRYKILFDTSKAMVKCISKYSSWNEWLKSYHNKDHWEIL